MLKSPFGKTGFNVTPLGLGAAEIGYLNPPRQQAEKILNLLLDAGVNVFDTAASYETSEEIIGQAIGRRRKEFVLISKCGNQVPGIDAPAWSAALIAQTVERALARLQTDVLDVMLLHSCDEATLRRGDGLAALAKARQAGKIRFAGYSGDNQAAAYAATLPDVAVIETSISIADQANIDLVLPLARQNQIGVLAKRPLANAAWKRLDEQPGTYKNYAKTYTDRLARMKLSPSDLGIGGPAELAWPELALRFTLSQGGVNTAIIGTTNPENARQNILLANKGALPEETVQKIRRAFKSARGGQPWPGQS
jgi:aryl-alcohol dehydrogenase-like predicted oxidoreductase